MEISIGYFLIGIPIAFGLGYIVALIKYPTSKEKEVERRVTIKRHTNNQVQCVGYRGGNKCIRMTSEYSINGLCNSCDDARFGY